MRLLEQLCGELEAMHLVVVLDGQRHRHRLWAYRWRKQENPMLVSHHLRVVSQARTRHRQWVCLAALKTCQGQQHLVDPASVGHLHRPVDCPLLGQARRILDLQRLHRRRVYLGSSQQEGNLQVAHGWLPRHRQLQVSCRHQWPERPQRLHL